MTCLRASNLVVLRRYCPEAMYTDFMRCDLVHVLGEGKESSEVESSTKCEILSDLRIEKNGSTPTLTPTGTFSRMDDEVIS